MKGVLRGLTEHAPVSLRAFVVQQKYPCSLLELIDFIIRVAHAAVANMAEKQPDCDAFFRIDYGYSAAEVA